MPLELPRSMKLGGVKSGITRDRPYARQIADFAWRGQAKADFAWRGHEGEEDFRGNW